MLCIVSHMDSIKGLIKMEKKGAKDKLTNCTKNNLQLTYGPGSTLCSRIFNFWNLNIYNIHWPCG